MSVMITVSTPPNDDRASLSSKLANTRTVLQDSYLSLRRHSSIKLLDKKLQTWYTVFQEDKCWGVQRLVEERRLPRDAARRVECWLHECRTMESRAKPYKPSQMLYSSIVQDCEAELHCLRNQLLIKTDRFDRIPHDLAKLRRWTVQEEDETLQTAKGDRDSTIPLHQDDAVSKTMKVAKRLSLELVREITEIAETEQDGGHDTGDYQLHIITRRPSCSEEWARRENEQETQRLQLAMRYKWPVNMRRAKTQHVRAMERQEWERDELVTVS